MNLLNARRANLKTVFVVMIAVLGAATPEMDAWAQAAGTPPKAAGTAATPSQGAQKSPATPPSAQAGATPPAVAPAAEPPKGPAPAASPSKEKSAAVKAGATPATAAASPSAAPAPSSGPSAEAGGLASSGTAERLDAATYAVRLRDLEARVDELKEQIRRSHTRLSLLSDTVLSGGVGGAEANVQFQNQLTNAYRVNRVLVVLDGAVQYKRQDDSGELSSQKLIPMFSGAVPPGDHTLQVVVGIQGHGYGVFSYLRAYKFEVKNTHSFTVSEGKSVKVDIQLIERGGATTPIEERPALRFTEQVVGRAESGGAGE